MRRPSWILLRWVPDSDFGGFPVQCHLDHCLPKTQLREQALRAVVAHLAPEYNLLSSPRVSPLDRGAHEALSGALAPRSLVDIDVVDESARAAQIPPARGLKSGEDVP